MRRETADVWTFDLDVKPAFEPGQFNMLYVFGVGEVAISMSGDPAAGTLVHTIRAVGAVTRAATHLKRGDVLGVRGPFGRGWPVSAAEGSDVLLVAGGLGLAPLRPALYAVLARRERYGNVSLLYGTRTPKDVLYRRELARLAARPDLEVRVTVDRAGPDWQAHVGVVTELIGRARFDPLHTTAFVCGPEVMMRFTVGELGDRGVSDERVYVSMERNMECAVAQCGHCQLGPFFVCREGPVLPFDRIRPLFPVKEI